MRRIALIVGIVIAVVAIVAIGYFLRSKPSDTAGPQEGFKSNTQNLPRGTTRPVVGTEKPGGVTRSGAKLDLVAENPVADYFIDDKSAILIVQPDGQIVRIESGKQEILNSTTLANLIRASFSFDGKKALVVFGDRRLPETSIFDLTAKSWEPLPLTVKSPAWSPVDHRLAYLADDVESSTAIFTLDTNDKKAKPQKIFVLHQEDSVLSWPRQNRMILAERPDASILSSIWALALDTKTLLPAAPIDQRGLLASWAKDADRGFIFISNSSQRGGNLAMVDNKGNTIAFTVQTFPGKCAFGVDLKTRRAAETAARRGTSTDPGLESGLAGHFAVCGIPKNWNELEQYPLPDTYLKRGVFSDDNFYRINLETGDIKTAHEQDAFYADVTNPKILAGKFFFVNRYDKKLYRLSLE
jgi:hypothetical protein